MFFLGFLGFYLLFLGFVIFFGFVVFGLVVILLLLSMVVFLRKYELMWIFWITFFLGWGFGSGICVSNIVFGSVEVVEIVG